MILMDKHCVAFAFVVLSGAVFADGMNAMPMPGAALTQRCGWFDNPSAQTASLLDRDGEWVISQQGGHSAQGGWPPKFKPSQWVRTGSGSYGYGCACMKVQVNASQQQITRIVSSQAKALSACRNDKHLKGKEPFNPLK
jgi:hypothetical protein